MSEQASTDAEFLKTQARSLSELRKSLLAVAAADEADESDIRAESANSATSEYEDDAQRLANLEVDENRVVRNLGRLERIDRALKKIEEGTYGLSDISGLPIPRERLLAVPEAICLASEESMFEGRVGVPR